MAAINPKNLAFFAFIVCALVAGFSFGIGGGELHGTKEWFVAIAFVLAVSALTALVVWAFSRMIARRKVERP